MSEKEVLVPNIGDFKDVEVIEVLIEAGSNINKDDPIITIESDKSSVEIPSPYSGSVKKVNLKVGDKVSEGSSILVIGSEEEKPDEQIEEEVKEIKEDQKKYYKIIELVYSNQAKHLLVQKLENLQENLVLILIILLDHKDQEEL